ncbi:MAG: putative ubiquinone biosynthesis monooxygenase [Trizodia sp. TS-e1964]|nr:MAG: putative ubiquinone biosynthesis monooxygenase [Trizodia sp. TS-e1964]
MDYRIESSIPAKTVMLLLRPPSLRSTASICCKRCTKRGNQFSSTRRLGSQEQYDIVCVGGGPAGLTLLAALRSAKATSHLRIALVESQDLQPVRNWNLPPDEYSNRVSSLTPTTMQFLRDIGAWSYLDHTRVQPYEEMQVWDGVSGARISFDWPATTDVAVQITHSRIIACMVENLNLVSGLLRCLDDQGSLAIYDNCQIQDITSDAPTQEQNEGSWPVLTLNNGKKLAARLLVGADGAKSAVRSFADITSRGWEYERHGVVATVELEANGWGGEVKTAYQRFLPSGPVALLPLPHKYSTLVWSTLPSYAKHLKTLSTPDFIAMVNAAFRLSPVDIAYMHTQPHGQVDELDWRQQHTPYDTTLIPQRIVGVQAGTVASFPLKMTHADTYVGPRIALIGDAAHTIHPLAGQGLNQGQADAQSLFRTISNFAACGQDIGVRLSLDPYNADRYAANNMLMGVVDKLHKLYSIESGPVVGLRSLGLRIVDSAAPLKEFFMRQAAGTPGTNRSWWSP